MPDTQINLIQKAAGGLHQFSRLEEPLRRASLWFLGVLFVAGLAIGITFTVVRSQIQQFEQTRARVVREINAQSVKEGILLSLKERTGIAGKALEAAKPWGKLFSVLSSLASEDAFNSISVDESGRVSTALELSSIDDTVTLITNTMNLAYDRQLRMPQMLSFAFREDGRIQISLSFFPIL